MLRRAHSAEDGVSLPELLVTMFLTGIVGVIVVGFFIAFTNTFTADRAATDSSTTAALGMNDVTRVIRAGTEIPVENQVLNIPVFERAENERMIIHAFIDTSSADPRPVKIEYYVNAQRELVERRYEAIALAPDNALAHLEWGISAQMVGRKSEAVGAALARAQSLAPENPRAQFEYALFRESQGDVEGAIEGYRATLRLRQDHARAREARRPSPSTRRRQGGPRIPPTSGGPRPSPRSAPGHARTGGRIRR